MIDDIAAAITRARAELTGGNAERASAWALIAAAEALASIARSQLVLADCAQRGAVRDAYVFEEVYGVDDGRLFADGRPVEDTPPIDTYGKGTSDS